jgi:hypothetical protein
MAYWLKQKQTASDTSRRQGSSRYASRDDRGSASSSDDQNDG